MSTQLSKATFTFLKDLYKNNDRPWFAENKPRYEIAKEDIKAFMTELLELLQKHDAIEGFKTMRIYRDVRFSKNKAPYKTNIGTGFTRAGAERRGGMFVNIEPGNTFVGGGFWAPEAKDLKRIRVELQHNADPLRTYLDSKKVKTYFGSLRGDAVKTAPKGFDKTDPNIDLIRYKQFLLTRSFTDAEALSSSFLMECDNTFKAMRPFYDYMSETLTTDENGVSIL